MKKLDFVKTTAVASIFAATIAASPAFANTTATFTVSDDAVKEIATIQRSMMEDADESESTSYEAGDEMAEGYLDPLDIQNDMPDAVSDEDLIEGEDTAVEVEVNSDTVILPTPEREGYVFIEWNSESDGSGESFQAGDTFVITSEVELFAIWEEKERSSLTLNFNEDSFVKENFFEEEGAKVHAVSTRSAGTSKNADEAVETETGSEETALKDSESTEISEIDSKDAETGSEEVDESSLDKAEAEEKETTKSSTDSSQDAEQVSEKDDTVEEEKVSDDNESEKSNAEDSSKEDSSDDSKSEDSTDSDSASNEDSSDSSDDADSRSDDTDDTSDTDNE